MDRKVNSTPEFHPEVVKACNKYATANRNAGKAHWVRAERAFDIKASADRHKQKYIAAATKLCGVERSVVVMDAMAVGMRRKLKYQTQHLPPESVSAFYELHRGFEVAMTIAGDDIKAKAEVEKKVKKIGQAIKDGAKVREVRKAFDEERQSQTAMKRAKRPVPEAQPIDPKVDRYDADGMKVLIDETCVPTGVAVPVVRIQPAEATPQAIKACLDDEKIQKCIADACPPRGNLWILVDLATAEKTVNTKQEETADKVVPGPSKAKRKKKGAA